MNIHGASLVINQDCQAYRGTIGIELALGGQLDLTVAQVMKLIDDTTNDFRVKVPLIIFDARTTTDFDNQDTRELALILKQRGCVVLAKLDGLTFPAFAEYATIVVAYCDSEWLNYRADEIIYRIRDDSDAIKLPMVYKLNQEARKSILLQKKQPVEKIYQAITKSDYPWAILVKPLFDYEVSLL